MPSDVWTAIWASEQAENGIWPEAGGWLDQTQSALDAFTFIWSETARSLEKD